MQQPIKKIPKILSPAGSYEACIAAIQHGADEVYIGGQEFGARAFAYNFTNEEIKQITRYAHIRGVAVYVTVNTLVNDQELSSIYPYLEYLYQVDVDGIIVHDFGILHYLRQVYPDWKVIASTQMNVHNLEGVNYLQQLGVFRVVLAREVDIETIRHIKQQVTGIEIEVFCHGALCVSYSGNCLLSSFIGKRSGNRGKCAQPCRLAYQMMKDQQVITQEGYYLSPKDLMTLEYLSKLLEVGVDSLKIEGRMKSPSYVALTTSIYKEALQQLANNQQIEDVEEKIAQLATAFNRNFTKGYLFFEKDRDLISEATSNHQGIQIGEVIALEQGLPVIVLHGNLHIHDGIRFVYEENSSGLMVNEMYVQGKLVKAAKQGELMTLETKLPIHVGSKVYKTLDAKQQKQVEMQLDKELKKSLITMEVYAQVGKPLVITLHDQNHQVSFQSSYLVEKALNHPMTAKDIYQKLGQLGHTPFELDTTTIAGKIEEGIIVPVKILKEAKNTLIDALVEKRALRYPNRNKKQAFVYPALALAQENKEVQLTCKVHTLEQLTAAREAGIKTIYVDDGEVYQQSQALTPNESLAFAMPRIKDASLSYPTILESASSLLIAQLGDYPINHPNKVLESYGNTLNHVALAFALTQMHRVTLSLESDIENTKSVLTQFQKHYKQTPLVTQVVYGYMDAMLLKYCPIAKVENIVKKPCQLCRNHRYQLQDRLGYRFPMIAYRDCTVRLLNSKRHVLFEELQELINIGIHEFRLDFTIESQEETKRIIEAFQQKLSDPSYRYSFGNATFGHYYQSV